MPAIEYNTRFHFIFQIPDESRRQTIDRTVEPRVFPRMVTLTKGRDGSTGLMTHGDRDDDGGGQRQPRSFPDSSGFSSSILRELRQMNFDARNLFSRRPILEPERL